MLYTPVRNNIKLRTLDPFREINETFPETTQILEHKSQGRKVFGWLCNYVPEEVIHAAGALPIRITGYPKETKLDDGTAYFYANNCSFARSCLQVGLRGGYGFLDGIVIGSTCYSGRRLLDLWRNYIGSSFHHLLLIPCKLSERAHERYYGQVVQFKQHLEEFLGVKITDEALYRSIETYNKSRELLGRLHNLRKLDNPPITAAETMEVVNASFRMPKELFNEYLTDLLDELAMLNSGRGGRARLMIIGSVLSNPELIESIEQQGGLVVADELCTGRRYWSDEVDVAEGRGALRAISERYLNNFPCAQVFPPDERFNRILDLARDFRVDGIISLIVEYCIAYTHDLALIVPRLEDKGIPVLALEVEYGTSGSGQIQTRVQAFLEMLEARRR